MAFVRKRRSSRHRSSFQVIECFRDGARVRQRTLLNLGASATLEQAIADARCRGAQERLRELLDFLRSHPGFV
jgi:hypothetical protein